jgi:hypothetical protein
MVKYSLAFVHQGREIIAIVALENASGRWKTCAHQNDIVWTLFDPESTTFIHF